jgi:hypothetical protein
MAKNFIGLKNHFILGKWLEGNMTKLADMTRPEAAVLASKELGFLITDNNMLGAIEATGLELKFRRMTQNCNAVTREAKRNVYPALAVRDLMRSLNYPVPAYLNALIAGVPMGDVDRLYASKQDQTSS